MTEKEDEMEADKIEEMKLKENPFENYLILRNVFKYVYCIEDLKNIRLTNSLWLQESSQQWDNVQIIYKISSHVHDKYRNPKKCSCGQSKFIPRSQSTEKAYSLQEFFAKWELAEPHQRQCMQRFRLTNLCMMHPPAHVEHSDFVRLLDLIGNQATYLHLDHCTIHPTRCMHGLTWILRKCLNLQTLIVILDRVCERFWTHPVIHQEQLETAPVNENLKWLSLKCCRLNSADPIPDTDFYSLIKIFPNVKSFETNFELSDVSFNSLMQHQPYPSTVVPWRLANLGLLIDHGEYTEDIIMNIQDSVPTSSDVKLRLVTVDKVGVFERRVPKLLTICQNSLTKLDIKRGKLPQVMSPLLSYLGGGLQFNCLTHLFLSGESSMSFASLKGAPNLKVLRLKSPGRLDWNRTIAAEGDIPEGDDILLDKLEAFYADYFWFLPKTMRFLKKWMPNVKKVGVVVTPVTLPLVMELWPDLDKLLLVKGSILVEGGLPISSDVAHVDNEIN